VGQTIALCRLSFSGGRPRKRCLTLLCASGGRGRDRGRVVRANRGHGRGPNDDRVRSVRAILPSSRCSKRRPHGEALSNGLRRTAGDSNIRYAIDTDVRPDTSSRPPSNNQDQELRVGPERREAAVAAQFLSKSGRPCSRRPEGLVLVISSSVFLPTTVCTSWEGVGNAWV